MRSVQVLHLLDAGTWSDTENTFKTHYFLNRSSHVLFLSVLTFKIFPFSTSTQQTFSTQRSIISCKNATFITPLSSRCSNLHPSAPNLHLFISAHLLFFSPPLHISAKSPIVLLCPLKRPILFFSSCSSLNQSISPFESLHSCAI